MNKGPFVIEQTYDALPEKVWAAISNNDKMKQWYFKLENFKPEVGFKFEFEGGSEEKSYTHLCKITAVDPGRMLQYSWSYKNYEGYSAVTWELFPEGNKTRLRLTHAGLDSFPTDNKDFAKESFMAGWAHITGISLKEFLEKSDAGDK